MFLLKTITIIMSAIAIIKVYFGAKGKSRRNKEEGYLTIKDLSRHYHELKIRLLQLSASKDEIKKTISDFKRKLKEKKKQDIRKKIYVIKFDGNIKPSAVESLREEITAVLSVARKKIDKVILILESPGGTVNGYGLAASELKRIKSREIELIAIVDKIAASGGYMMACVADKVIAAPFAIIGSIGVVSQTPNFNQLLKHNGIEYEQVTSGKYKRTITMFGQNTDEGRKKLQLELEAIHNQFKSLIKTHRPGIDIEKISTGEFWLAEKAKELNLVDDLMTSDEYLMILNESGSDIYQVEYKKEQNLVTQLVRASSNIKGIFHSHY